MDKFILIENQYLSKNLVSKKQWLLKFALTKEYF